MNSNIAKQNNSPKVLIKLRTEKQFVSDLINKVLTDRERQSQQQHRRLRKKQETRNKRIRMKHKKTKKNSLQIPSLQLGTHLALVEGQVLHQGLVVGVSGGIF